MVPPGKDAQAVPAAVLSVTSAAKLFTLRVLRKLCPWAVVSNKELTREHFPVTDFDSALKDLVNRLGVDFKISLVQLPR